VAIPSICREKSELTEKLTDFTNGLEVGWRSTLTDSIRSRYGILTIGLVLYYLLHGFEKKIYRYGTYYQERCGDCTDVDVVCCVDRARCTEYTGLYTTTRVSHIRFF
jgi:hypothetical protein